MFKRSVQGRWITGMCECHENIATARSLIEPKSSIYFPQFGRIIFFVQAWQRKQIVTTSTNRCEMPRRLPVSHPLNRNADRVRSMVDAQHRHDRLATQAGPLTLMQPKLEGIPVDSSWQLPIRNHYLAHSCPGSFSVQRHVHRDPHRVQGDAAVQCPCRTSAQLRAGAMHPCDWRAS